MTLSLTGLLRRIGRKILIVVCRYLPKPLKEKGFMVTSRVRGQV